MGLQLLLFSYWFSLLFYAAKMSDRQLEIVFNSFCAFGAGSNDSQAMMDNAQFGKLFRDLKLYDKNFTSTDTDIIFNRPEVKSKEELKINFNQFKVALGLCAEKKYGSKDDVQKLIDTICSRNRPGTSGLTKTVKPEGVDRLTNANKYNGTHKERFEKSGNSSHFDKAVEGHVETYKAKETHVDNTH